MKMNIESMATYVPVPIGAIVGATMFQDLFHTMWLSCFGAVAGFVVRLILDYLHGRIKAKQNGKDRKRKV